MSAPKSVAAPETWEQELADSLAVLLGKPLGEFPKATEYAFCYLDDQLSHMILEELVSGELDLSAVMRGEPIDGGRRREDSPFGLSQWALDLGRSTWLFEEEAFDTDGGLGESIGTALRAISTATDDGRWAVSGADLALVLAAHKDELDEVDSDEVVAALVLRVGTDGTLFDAMRAATWTMGGPDGLVGMEEGRKLSLSGTTVCGGLPTPNCVTTCACCA